MKFLFQLLIKILFLTSGYCIKVDYLRGVPRLGNTSYWDYYFNCNTEGQNLRWEVNGNFLGGFLSEDVARVFSSSRSNFDYVATLLSATPASGTQYNFVSMLIVSSLGYLNLEVICRSDLSLSMTNNTENRTYVEDMTNTSLISLQYLLDKEIVSADSFRIRIFVCGVDYFFLNWQTDIKICTFTISDTIGQNLQTLTQNDTTVLQQALIIAQEPYPIVSILLVTGNSDVNVKCRNSEGTLQFPIATVSTGTENEPISTELNSNTRRPVGTNTRSIDGILIVALVPSAVVLLLAIIIVVVVVIICKRKEKKKEVCNPQSTEDFQMNNGEEKKKAVNTKGTKVLQEYNEEEKQKDVNPQGTEDLQDNDNKEENKKDVKCQDTEDLQECNKEEEKNEESVNPQDTEDIKESDKEEEEKNEDCVNSPHPEDSKKNVKKEDGKQKLREKYLRPKCVKDFEKERKKKSIKYEYEFLRRESTVLSTTEAQKHKDKNRYPKILPYDSTRVKLDIIEGVEGSDYINASYIDGYKSSKHSKVYIAAQSPLSNTIGDFWRMIYEQQVTTIVMFGRNVEKLCPKNGGEIYGNIQVTCKKVWCITNFEVREFELDEIKETGGQEPKFCKQYRFLSWPTHGVPQFPTPLIQFIREVKSHRKDSDKSPIVVHSKGGIGRAGVFITLHAIMEQIEDEQEFSVFKFVNQMRNQRKCMVNSMDEYLFIYNVLHEVCICNDGKTSAMDEQALRKKIKDNPITGETEFKFLGSYIDNWIKKMSLEAIELKYDDDNYGLFSTYNAFSIHGYKQKNAYIAAPIPTEKAKKNDFWHLIWQKQSQVIVVLDPLQEDNLFWPTYEPETFDELIVSFDEKPLIFKDYTKRICHIKSLETDNILVVTIYQHEYWQDYMPSSSKISGIVKFISELELNIHNYKHIVVMSRDGDGHTGTFITIHAMIEKVQIDNMVDFFQFIMLSRIHGYKLIKYLEHYQFCHEVLDEYMKNMQRCT